MLGNVLAEAPERLLALSKLSRQELQEVTFFSKLSKQELQEVAFSKLSKNRVARGDFSKQRVAIIAKKV